MDKEGLAEINYYFPEAFRAFVRVTCHCAVNGIRNRYSVPRAFAESSALDAIWVWHGQSSFLILLLVEN